jgi:hypothetical protein
MSIGARWVAVWWVWSGMAIGRHAAWQYASNRLGVMLKFEIPYRAARCTLFIFNCVPAAPRLHGSFHARGEGRSATTAFEPWVCCSVRAPAAEAADVGGHRRAADSTADGGRRVVLIAAGARPARAASDARAGACSRPAFFLQEPVYACDI